MSESTNNPSTTAERNPALDKATGLLNWRIEPEKSSPGIYWLILDRAGASQNSLSEEVVKELDKAIDIVVELNAKGIILRSGKPGSFIVGADVSEFADVPGEKEALEYIREAHRIFARLEDLAAPVVAMIQGHCLGGGLELALACRYRVCADDDATRLGFPEVMLGIHPGFGGTVRSIETIGAAKAMEMMLTGRNMRARAARRSGLVDMAVAPRHLTRAALKLIQSGKPRRVAKGAAAAANYPGARHALAKVMRDKTSKRASKSHYPAPFSLIDLWVEHGGDREEMFEAEAQSVARLITSDTSRGLVKVFFLQEQLKDLGKNTGADGAPKVERVHVIGAGVMGGDIAAWCAAQGLEVTIQDRAPEALARVVSRAHKLFSRRLKDPMRITAAMDRFMPDAAGNGIARADVVIEAIFENIEAKQGLFRDVEPRLKPGAVLATNTSSIPLETLSEALARPERLVGLHFFNPVAKMQLVEIVASEQTAQVEIDRAAAFAHQISRLPVPVNSSPGFLVNRILMPYLMEAVELLDEGVPGPAIDKAATEFGMPMGPITLADTVGLDICLSVAKNLGEAFGDEVPVRLIEKVEAGDLGKKTGRGFYEWKKGKPVKGRVDKSSSIPEDMEDRMILRFVNEAVACLREGVVADTELLDGGVIFGTGFAPFRGGPMNYIRDEGVRDLRERLEELAKRYGDRFEPDLGWDTLDDRLFE